MHGANVPVHLPATEPVPVMVPVCQFSTTDRTSASDSAGQCASTTYRTSASDGVSVPVPTKPVPVMVPVCQFSTTDRTSASDSAGQCASSTYRTRASDGVSVRVAPTEPEPVMVSVYQ